MRVGGCASHSVNLKRARASQHRDALSSYEIYHRRHRNSTPSTLRMAEEQCKDYLAVRLLTEGKPVTYRLLSRATKTNVHTAKWFVNLSYAPPSSADLTQYAF